MFKSKVKNTLVIGEAGSMKTYGYVIPRLMESDCSYVIHDPFGDILENTREHLKEKGYDVRVLALDFSVYDKGTERMGHYNPFVYAEDGSDISSMADAVIAGTRDPDQKSFEEPDFFGTAEKHLLSAMMLYLLAEYAPEDRTFANLMKLCVGVMEDPFANLDELFGDLETKDPGNSAVKQYMKFKEYATNEKVLRTTLISCAVHLSIFRVKKVQALTNTDDIDLRSIRSRKTALFVITNTVDNSFAPLVTLLYKQVIKYATMPSSDRNNRGLPVHIILDEAPALRGVFKAYSWDIFQRAVLTGNCSFSFVMQSLYQLKYIFREDWEQFVESCDEIHYYGGHDHMTHQHISKLTGGKVTEEELHFTDRDKGLVLKKCIFKKGYSVNFIAKKRWEKN